MVRPLRILYKDAVYHVISKGNLDDFILAEDEDKRYFLGQLRKGAERYKVTIFAYCLMGNHYHLLIQTHEENLPQFMHFLLSSYATYLYREKGKKGHIFAGRYKAILIDTEEYLLTVSKYIHRNPEKAALVSSPLEYGWSSYAYFVGSVKVPKWMRIDWVTDFFGPELKDGITAYREFVEMDMDKEYKYPSEKVIAQSILGNEDFVKEAVSKHETSLREKGITARNELLTQLSLQDLGQAVCERYGIHNLKMPLIEGKSLHRRARNVFILMARCYTHSSNSKIAEFLGDIGRTGVAESYRRSKERLLDKQDSQKSLNDEIDIIISGLNENQS